MIKINIEKVPKYDFDKENWGANWTRQNEPTIELKVIGCQGRSIVVDMISQGALPVQMKRRNGGNGLH